MRSIISRIELQIGRNFVILSKVSRMETVEPPLADVSAQGNRDFTEDKISQSGSPEEHSDNICTNTCTSLRVNRTLLPVKIIYFNVDGGLRCAFTYMSLFLKQLGLSPLQIGLISGLRPLVGAVSGPLWGILGDKYNIRRCLLLFSLSAWMACFVAFYFIPTPERSGVCPTNITLNRLLITVEPKLKKTLSGLLKSGTDRPMIYNNTDTTSPFTPEELWSLRRNIWWVYRPDGLRTVFILSLLLIVGGEVVQSPTTAMVDAGTMQMLGPAGMYKYGSQKAWGSIGTAICTFVPGALVSASRRLEVICGIELYFSDYRRVAYVFIGILIVAFIAATQLKFMDNEDPEKIALTNLSEAIEGEKKEAAAQQHSTIAVLQFFGKAHHFSYLATFFYMGVSHGVIWGFLYWHLENLGANQLLIGLDNGIQSLSNFAFCFLISKATRFIGHAGIMYSGLAAMSLRFFCYSLITNPWIALPVDILDGITFNSVWVSMISYTALYVPDISFATVQGILHGANIGLGNGLGHLLGGMLIGYFGATVTFLSMAVFTVLVLISFIVTQKCSKATETNKLSYRELQN